MAHILAIDQGTTSSRAILFDAQMKRCALAQQEFAQHFPAAGWVEHDPEEIWSTVLATARGALDQGGIAARDLAGIGITNQRETTILWERDSGRPLAPAIVWQDRRTAATCAELRKGGHAEQVSALTGLVIDPYFSATKVKWILDRDPDLRARALRGEILFGTVDTFLIWRLTGGKVHATDATNAARTMLFDIHAGCWSAALCDLFGVPMAMLPEVRDCAGDFGTTDPDIFGARVPILGVAGDQQAAAMGQACFTPGMIKATYGTGCFALLNTGAEPVASHNRLLTTIAWQLDGSRAYALEGSIFVAGAVVQWLRDGLGLIDRAEDSGALAAAADSEQDLVIVPAFTGLGAPHWAAECRGAVFGLTRNSGPAEFARAALESVAFQTRDLWEAMRADWQGAGETVLRVDGGMCASDWTMQALADTLGAPVDRALVLETTALGAAWLAGMTAGIYPGMAEFSQGWACERRFEPRSAPELRDRRYRRWQRAVRAAISV
ncbi:glycerol kinase GlpK [Pontibaca methylaminivorans]|uniref:glycerol kinase GlpK n=1 Tax=Pontibaca methylaminivorans TaxID=515897 RepID=UPI002FD8C4FD